VTPDTEHILLEQVAGLRTDVSALTRKVAEISERAAHDEGLEQGLALKDRMSVVEADMLHRPTTAEIAQMLDNRLKTLAIRAGIAAFAAVPVWMGAGVALAAYLGK
jgi:hypothetical protein